MSRIKQPARNVAPRLRAQAGLLLGLFLLVLAMAQIGALHRLLHADSSTAEHQCAVTLLAGGQVDVAPGELPVALRPVLVIAPVRLPAQVFATVDYSLLPGRAPPVALA